MGSYIRMNMNWGRSWRAIADVLTGYSPGHDVGGQVNPAGQSRQRPITRSTVQRPMHVWYCPRICFKRHHVGSWFVGPGDTHGICSYLITYEDPWMDKGTRPVPIELRSPLCIYVQVASALDSNSYISENYALSFNGSNICILVVLWRSNELTSY